jgi:hypothetical protein
MAITETRPEPTTVEPHVNPWGDGDEYPSFARSLGSSDHKTIGRLFIGFSLVFGVAAWVLVALSSLQDINDVDVIEDSIFQVFTLGRLGLIFLFALPLFLRLAVYLVPLQVGASTIAFPRAQPLVLDLAARRDRVHRGLRLERRARRRRQRRRLSYVALATLVLALFWRRCAWPPW